MDPAEPAGLRQAWQASLLGSQSSARPAAASRLQTFHSSLVFAGGFGLWDPSKRPAVPPRPGKDIPGRTSLEATLELTHYNQHEHLI